MGYAVWYFSHLIFVVLIINQMKRFLLATLLFVTFSAQSQVVINELDCDQPVIDMVNDASEFVELLGAPNTSLDGLVVVFYNGSNDLSYQTFSLNGFSTDNNGLFVLGNAGVNGVQIIFPENTLQNGADAVAIYSADISAFPASTPVTNTGLVDALVYGTLDLDDTVLLSVLTPGQIQADENAESTGTAVSLSRVPDGGSPFASSNFVRQAPTPGAFNAGATPTCIALDVVPMMFTEPITSCSNEDEDPYFFSLSGAPEVDETYFYALVDFSGLIVALSDIGSFDLDLYPIGQYEVFAVVYTGNLDGTTIEEGDLISAVDSDDCIDVSNNSVDIVIEDCSLPVCVGGTITSEASFYSICNDGEADFIEVGLTGNEPQDFLFLLTTASNTIVQVLDAGLINLDNLPFGAYRIWGLSYYPNLDASTLEIGDDATLIATDGACVALTDNFITIQVLDCSFENGCESLIISEYFEGSSFNKAIELYNTSIYPIDLDNYEVFLYTNGSTTFNTVFAPEGILAGGETYVIAHPQAGPELLAIADAQSTVVNFNGDDAFVLQQNGVDIDAIGVIGQDPGDFWSVGSGTTQNFALTRLPFVTEGTTDWSVAANQYAVVSSNVYSTIGQHDFIPCSDVPVLGFEISAQSVEEGVGTYDVAIIAYNIPVQAQLELSFIDGTALAGEDYVNDGPQVLTFEPGNSQQTISIQVIDDLIEEDNVEFFTLQLTALNGEEILIPEFTLTIVANDQSYPLYSIAEVKGTDANGILDSSDVPCELRGIVHGINFNAQGIHFHLLDETGGIKVFSALENLGYSVSEGDSIHVQGIIDQFMGQSEIRPDAITLIDQNHPLFPSTVVTSITEENESSLVTIECVELVDQNQWTGEGSFFVVDAEGSGVFQILIDGDSEIFDEAVIDGRFTLTGIVEQMDESAPYDQGYVIYPRYMEDITEQVIASFAIANPVVFGDNGVTVDITNTSTNGATLEWDLGDGQTLEGDLSEYFYSYDALAPLAELTVTLIASLDGCTDASSITVDVVYSSVEENSSTNITAYPVPASDFINLEVSQQLNLVRVFDIAGKEVTRLSNVNIGTTRLDVGNYPSGVYTILCESDNASQTLRVIVK